MSFMHTIVSLRRVDDVERHKLVVLQHQPHKTEMAFFQFKAV